MIRPRTNKIITRFLLFFVLLGAFVTFVAKANAEPGDPGSPLNDAEWRYVGTMATSICRSLVMPGVDSIAAVVGTKEAVQASGGFEESRAVEIVYVTVQMFCPGEMVVITNAIEKNERIQQRKKGKLDHVI